MRLYKVKVSYEVYVVANTIGEATQLPWKNKDFIEQVSMFGAISASVPRPKSSIPTNWRYALPWNSTALAGAKVPDHTVEWWMEKGE